MTTANGWKIVLIDDEEDIRTVMTLALEDAGYHVAAAGDGKTGLLLCQDTAPQIVITDIRMPGMDGLQVLEVLKDRHPDIEVIVATAFGEMGLAIRALQLDASDFITKPIGEEALYLALKRAQQRYTSRKQLQDYTALLEKENAKTSQELLRNLAFQKNLIEGSMDGILGCDGKNRVVIFNKSMEKMLGYSKQQVLNTKTLEHFFVPGEVGRLRAELGGTRYGGKNRLFRYETTLLGFADRRIPVQVSATVLSDEGCETEGFVFYFRDLREIRSLEREVADQARILHQDKMMSLGRLSASVVHEINNPLSGILNYIRLMLRILERGSLNGERQAKFRRYLALVETETSRCAQIVSGLLTFSRISPPSFEPVRIDELIKRCILLSQHKLELSNIRLETAVAADLPPVNGDFNQLQQCIINLVFNAIDAMPHGGTLQIEGRYDAADEAVSIAVQDSGPGIPTEVLPHIFEPFYTTKKEGHGVGLGLSTVYGIMERHKGSVSVESRPQEGTTFKLKLPLRMTRRAQEQS